MMKSHTFIALILYFMVAAIDAQVERPRPIYLEDDREERLAKLITEEGLHRHLSILASDEYQGRETGEEGQKMAAEYISRIFRSYELPVINEEGSYYQHYSYITENWKNISLTINDKEYTHMLDYYSFPSKNSDQNITADEITFLGYGIDEKGYSDYRGVDVKGKILFILAGEPKYNGAYLLGTGDAPSEWSGDLNKKLRAAKANGAKAMLILSDNFSADMKASRKKITSRRRRMGWSENAAQNYTNSCIISDEMAEKMLGEKYDKIKKLQEKIDKRKKPQNLTFSLKISLKQKKKVKEILGENVVGIIEGTDDKLRDEYVFVTAHYDHLGVKRGKVYNGADDNGSGTASLLEIARAFSEAKKKGWGPKRTVVIMLVSGEEKGLLGSKYYVEHPLIPLSKTVVDINIDMVGRIDDRYVDNPNYIYVIGADRLSSELHAINEAANKKYTKLKLDYTYNADDDPNRYYYRSDHYSFAEKGIPAVFYFNGTHDDYHRASDIEDKINYEALTKRTKLFFHTAWEIANREKRLEVDVNKD